MPQVITLRGPGLPSRLRNRVTYDAGSMQIVGSSTNGYGETVFALNNLYDPDYSNIADNKSIPLFDDMAQLYNRWRVLGAKVTMTCQNNNSQLADVGMYLSEGTAAIFNSASLSLQNAPKHLYGHRLIGGSSHGDSAVKTISKYYNLVGIYGKQVASDITWAGAGNTAPTSVVYLHVGGKNKFNSVSGSLAFTCALNIEFLIEWTAPAYTQTEND